MASNKEYSYQIRGKQIALLEKDVISSDALNYTFPRTGTAGDGLVHGSNAGSTSWKSPISTVADGLEIEYVYSPTYSVESTGSIQINKFYINGWTVIDGYLTFVRSHSASVPNWTSAPYSTVTSGSEGDTGGQSLDYIVVQGSSRWNGLHRVQTAGTDGTLKTYTKVNKTVERVEGSSNIDITAEEDTDSDGVADRSRIAANNSSNIWLNNIFSTNDYIFITGSEQAVNNGFWQVSDVQGDSSNEIDSGIYIKNRYYCYNTGNTLSTEGEDTIPDTYATYDESVKIYKVYRDFSYILTDVNVLNDEDDEIDLPLYLIKALVLFVKAKIAEDSMNIEMKEYFMKEFRKMVEKHESGKIWGGRQIMAGSGAIR
tara:strand:- start:42 stop:1154 length:1113 start_codon:yes stop_codon:yes gene_type:complete